MRPYAEPAFDRGGRGRRRGAGRGPAALRVVLLLAHPLDPRSRAHRRAEPADPAARCARRARRPPAGHRRPPLRRRLRLALLRAVRGERPGPRPLPSRRHGLQAHLRLPVHHLRPRRLPALRPDPGGERDLRVVPVRARGRRDDRAPPQLAGRGPGAERAPPSARRPVRGGDPARTPGRPRGGVDLGDPGRVHPVAVQRRVHPRDRRGALEELRPRAGCACRRGRGADSRPAGRAEAGAGARLAARLGARGGAPTRTPADPLLLRRHRPRCAPVRTRFAGAGAHRPPLLRPARTAVLRAGSRGGRGRGRAAGSGGKGDRDRRRAGNGGGSRRGGRNGEDRPARPAWCSPPTTG